MHMVYSHPQANHIGVTSLVAAPGKSIDIIAHEDTKGLLQEVPDASLPTITLKVDCKSRVGQPDAGAALRRREPRLRQHLHLHTGTEAARPHRRRFPWLGPLRVPGRRRQRPRLDRAHDKV